MSKSLKNFITISDALKQPESNSRSLRICFLFSVWHDKIEITESILKSAAAWESKLNNFFLHVLDIARSLDNLGTTLDSIRDEELGFEPLDKAKADLHEALCDDFDTPAAMRIISNFVSECNVTDLSSTLLLSGARWVTRIVTIFGLNPQGEPAVLAQDESNRNSGQQLVPSHYSQVIAWHGVEIPAAAQQPIHAASKLRDDVRQQILSRRGDIDYRSIIKLAHGTQMETPADSDNRYQVMASQFRNSIERLATESAPPKDILSLCDAFRDIHLVSLNIYLEDRENAPALVRPLDPTLQKALTEKHAAAAMAETEKERRRAEKAEQQLAWDNQASVDPKKMFKNEKYLKWDEQGIPTQNVKGEEVTKSARKKLVKLYDKQQKMHREWLDRQDSR